MLADRHRRLILRMARSIPRVALPSRATMPALGMGTWRMGERARERTREVAALRLGIELGMALIDSAERYADGGAEEVVGEALAGRRDEAFLVSQVYADQAGRRGGVAACRRSLKGLSAD